MFQTFNSMMTMKIYIHVKNKTAVAECCRPICRRTPDPLALALASRRRAYLKECFEALKKSIPNIEEKKTSNLTILRGALRYVQVRPNTWYLGTILKCC